MQYVPINKDKIYIFFLNWTFLYYTNSFLLIFSICQSIKIQLNNFTGNITHVNKKQYSEQTNQCLYNVYWRDCEVLRIILCKPGACLPIFFWNIHARQLSNHVLSSNGKQNGNQISIKFTCCTGINVFFIGFKNFSVVQLNT